MQRAVDDVIEICADEGIDADIAKDGTLAVATNPAQLGPAGRGRRRPGVGRRRRRVVELSAAELSERVSVAGALGATYAPIAPGAAGQTGPRPGPGRGAQGRAHFRGFPALAVAPGRVTTPSGPVHAH